MTSQLQFVVGRNLRKRRKDLGMSQEKFADYLNFHRTYVGALERGERNLSLKSLEQLAALLDMDPFDLLVE